MKGFVDAVHDLGMKFMLWYSVPLVGEESENFPRFQGKYLRHWQSQGAYVLDPRYPEVREFIIGTYLQAMADWGLDGFKLDFIGMLAANDTTVLTAEDGRDYASVNEAADRLMTDVMATSPRGESGGPHRVPPALYRPPDAEVREHVPGSGRAQQRLGQPGRGHRRQTPWGEHSAPFGHVHVASGGAGGGRGPPVPERALRRAPGLGETHPVFPRATGTWSAAWTRYWKENREALMRGAFIPSGPGSVYPVLLAHLEGKAIAGVYSDAVVRLPDPEFHAVDLVNAKASRITGPGTGSTHGKGGCSDLFDTRGQETGRHTRTLGASIHRFEAPPSGRVEIRRR